MIVDTTVQGVTFRDVNRKSDGKSIRIYEIVDGNNTKWTTSRIDIANEANAKLGQPVQISGRQEINGVYENFYLDAIGSPNGLTPPPSQQFPIPETIAAQITHVPAPQAAPQPQPAPIPTPPPPPVEIAPTGPTDKDWTIWRQVATKVAVNLSATPAEFWANTEDLIRYYAYGVKPQLQAIVTSPPTGNQFVPEQAFSDPGPDPNAPEYSDDDIPF